MVLITPVSAQKASFKISIDLGIEKVHETIDLSLQNTGADPLRDFSYALPLDAQNIIVKDDEGPLLYEEFKADEILLGVSLRRPLSPGDETRVFIDFDTSELVSRTGEDNIFSARFAPPKEFEDYVILITLPKGMGLSNPISEGTRTDIVPLPDDTLSDGQRTTFRWVVPSGESDFAVFLRYSSFPSEVENVGSQGYNVLISTIPLIIFIVLMFIIYRTVKKPKKEKKTLDFMKDDERIIIGLIRAEEGIVQRRIVDKTGFSKSKVSGIVKSLENRGILRVEKIGRRNKLYLLEEFKNAYNEQL